MGPHLMAAAGPGVYIGVGSFTIQFGNLIVIVVMILLFAAALLLPFPPGRKRQ
ncbi:hypothetical protein KIH31_01030 [Paenarthrobacter sp. DKR-5]|uniref:hypothetical protein n=1 Tax=Paenarthrobacter sp. DKR-5 TaxID=2835535 RepID=UPI001BDBCD53|nr:hypothetical protein [Paenarthrobacter sp. DKR-5]MBT1001171.1 hypothetical protein [Paenarthrobacter sp. DKR-5]